MSLFGLLGCLHYHPDRSHLHDLGSSDMFDVSLHQSQNLKANLPVVCNNSSSEKGARQFALQTSLNTIVAMLLIWKFS